MAAERAPTEADVVAELEALAGRLTWASANDWLAGQPEWLRRFTEGRDPVDNGANVLVMADGLREAARRDDRVGELLAQLVLLRTVEVPADSVIFERLGREVAELGDLHVGALFELQRARTQIYHQGQPEQVLAHLRAAVDAAEQAQDRYLDLVVSDWVGSYAVMIGALEAARQAFTFMGAGHETGTQPWLLRQLNLASVAIAGGELERARSYFAQAQGHLAEAPAPTQNFAAWIEILSSDRIQVLDRARLSEMESLVVRKRAMRRFYFADLFGIIPVEQCVEEVLAGVPIDASTGLVTVATLQSFLDESVAIGRTTQLASVGLPQLLHAAGRAESGAASALVDRVVERFASAHTGRLVIARLDLDRYAVFGDLEPDEFERHFQDLLDDLQRPLSVAGQEPLLLRPLARVTTSLPGDTGYSVWERVFSVPRGDTPGAPIHVTAPDTAEADRRHRLAQALLSDGLYEYAHVAFQPIVDVDAEVVRGFEALLRWESPELGRVPPPLVIEVAERCGAIGRLERHIVTSALTAAVALGEVSPACRVNVNLTAEQLADPSMAEHLIAECGRLGVPASRIGVELTESALIDHQAASASLDVLAADGFSIALDDFGTGYSNLTYLVEMRNVGLKIDGSFVRRMLEDDRAEMVCRMLISAAETLGAPIVAEQVENDAQVAALRQLGCVLHQGYRYAPALPLEDACEVLADPASRWHWPSVERDR